MANIALLADIHLGVPGRLTDSMWAMRVVREYCRSKNITEVIVLGDLYHNRELLAIDVLQQAVDFFEETARYDQRWITFPGNHDLFLRHSWNVSSLAPMRKYLTYINDIKILTIDDKRFWILPFITFEKSYMKVLKRIEEQHEEGDTLLTHIGVRGATLNTCFLFKDWSVVDFTWSKFKRIYTGHFHSKQEMKWENGNQLWYPGSLIPFKFDEGDIPHGFFVLDTDTNEHKFIDIWKAGAHFFPNETPPPQYCTIPHEQIGQITPTDIKGNIVRIAIDRDFTNEEKRIIKDEFTNMGALQVGWLNLAQKLDVTKANHFHTPSKNLFETWLETDEKGTSELDKRILRQVHQDVVHEGDELYSQQSNEDGE